MACPDRFRLVPTGSIQFRPVQSRFQPVQTGLSQFSLVLASSNWFRPAPTCSSLSELVPTSSERPKPVLTGPDRFQACSSRSEPVPTGLDRFKPVLAGPDRFWPVPTGSNWSEPGPTGPGRFKPVPTSPNRFWPVQAGSAVLIPTRPNQL